MSADENQMMTLIRKAVPRAGEPPEPIDLWPRVEQRLGTGRVRPGQLDWLLAGLVVGLIAGFPEAVLLVLYHL